MPTITIEIASAVIAKANEVSYPMPYADMTNEALLHVIEYGWQRMVNDKANSKGRDSTEADKAAAAQSIVDRAKANPYVRRAQGEGSDPLETYISAIMRRIVKTDGELAKAYKAAKGDTRSDMLDDLFHAQPVDIQVAIRAEATQDKALADAETVRTLANAKALTAGMTLKLPTSATSATLSTPPTKSTKSTKP